MPVGKYKKSGYLKYQDPTEMQNLPMEYRAPTVQKREGLKNAKLTREGALKFAEVCDAKRQNLQKQKAAELLAQRLHKIQIMSNSAHLGSLVYVPLAT